MIESDFVVLKRCCLMRLEDIVTVLGWLNWNAASKESCSQNFDSLFLDVSSLSRFFTMSCRPCVCGCPCMFLTTADFITASSCWGSSSLSCPKLQLLTLSQPVHPSASLSQLPAPVPTITVVPDLMVSSQEEIMAQMRRDSSALPLFFSFSTRRWSCVLTLSSPTLDMRLSGVIGITTQHNTVHHFHIG